MNYWEKMTRFSSLNFKVLKVIRKKYPKEQMSHVAIVEAQDKFVPVPEVKGHWPGRDDHVDLLEAYRTTLWWLCIQFYNKKCSESSM